jgi:hypothetical protein
MEIERSRRQFLAMAVALAGAAAVPVLAQPRTTFGEAMAVLAQHRSAGEQAAALLKRYRPKDVRGRALYARAKAAFDGIIGGLLADLASDRRLQLTPAFEARLKSAANDASAFGKHVDAILREVMPPGAKSVLKLLLADPAKLVESLTNSGLAIWREANGVAAKRRSEIAARIEQERWRPFSEIPRAQ